MSSIVERLGWMLLHSLWQGAAGWIGLQFALLALQRHTARVRYLTACAALVFVTLAPFVTFFCLDVGSRLDARAPSVRNSPDIADPRPQTATPSLLPSPGPAASSSAAIRATARWSETRNFLRVVLPWLVHAWALGCCFCLARLAYNWRSVGRLRTGDDAPVSDVLRRLFDRARQHLGLTRAVALRISRQIDVPAVIGWVKPVVLVPGGALIGLSELQIEALFVHELAHVLHHDFAINVLQEVSEALFYYHPAVKAINRTIRHERELACDDLAVSVTGDRLGYAQALASIEAARTPQLVVAATGTDGDLLMRIKRLLGLTPHTPLRLSRVAWVGLAAIAGYFCLLFGAPALTAKILNARQRVETIRAAVPETWIERVTGAPTMVKDIRIGSGRYVGPIMRVEGELRDAEGALVHGRLYLEASLSHDNTNAAIPLEVQDGKISEEIPSGRLTVNTWVPGYAPLVAGPFLPDRNSGAVHLDLRIRRGFSATLRLLDPSGRPVTGAVLVGTVQETDAARHDGWLITMPEHRSDTAGLVVIDDLDAHTELSLRAEKEGYRTQERIFRGSPGTVTDWVLPVVLTVRDRVVDAETQRPIANARIALAYCGGSATLAGARVPRYETVLATTDDAGRFSISTLNPDWDYRVYVEAEGYATVCESLPTGADREFQLNRGLTLSGTVQGVPPGIAKLECRYRYQVTPTESTVGSQTIELPDTGSTRSFAFEHLPTGEVALALNDVTKQLVLNESRSDVAFDVAAAESPPACTVTIILVPPDANVDPLGTVKATYRHLGGVGGKHSVSKRSSVYESRSIALQGGRAVLSDVVPGRLELVADGMIGYWFDRQTVDIGARTAPLELKIPVEPAGALEGEVIEDPQEDYGGPANLVGCVAVGGNASRAATSVFAGAWSDNGKPRGHFAVSPLPLDSRYVVVVGSSYNYTVSTPVRIDAAQPLAALDIHRSRGAVLVGSVVDAEGNPAKAQALQWNYHPSPGWSIGSRAVTDAQGRFALPNVNLNVPGFYELSAMDDSHMPLGSVKIDRTTPQPIRLILRRPARSGTNAVRSP